MDFDGPVSNILQVWQPPAQDLSSANFMAKELKEGIQRMRTNVDLTRNPSEGGLANRTLGAANLVASQGDTREADLLSNIEIGLSDLAEINMNTLQLIMPEAFTIKAKPGQPGQEIMREDILGTFNYKFKSALQKTKQTEASRVMNGVNTMVNWINTGHPIFQRLNLEEPIRDAIGRLELGDTDNIFPKEVAQDQMAMAPTMVPPGEALPPELGGQNVAV